MNFRFVTSLLILIGVFTLSLCDHTVYWKGAKLYECNSPYPLLIICKSLARGTKFPTQLEDHILKEDVFVSDDPVSLNKGDQFFLMLSTDNNFVKYRLPKHGNTWIIEDLMDEDDFCTLRKYLLGIETCT